MVVTERAGIFGLRAGRVDKKWAAVARAVEGGLVPDFHRVREDGIEAQLDFAFGPGVVSVSGHSKCTTSGHFEKVQSAPLLCRK